MLNNGNLSLDQALQIVNNHKMKSSSMKNYLLRNKNSNINEQITKILNYLSEVEYDLEILNNLISNYQLCYSNFMQDMKNWSIKECNYNKEIIRLNEALNKANNEINSLKNNNINALYENKKVNDNNNDNNLSKLNKTFTEVDNYRNYLNYANFTTSYLDSPCAQKYCFDCKKYGKLTYTRISNENNIKPNNSKILNYNYLCNDITSNNNINNKFYNKINNDDINLDRKENIYPENDYLNKRIYYPLYNNVNKNENENEKEYENRNKFINCKNISPPHSYYSNNSIIKNDDDRINNIYYLISSDENNLNELKSAFGNNIDSQLLKGELSDELLDKIENFLCNLKSKKSIIPLSKRFQIQNRAKSNLAKKIKKSIRNSTNSKNNRFIRQKLSLLNLNNKGSQKSFNSTRDRQNKYLSKSKEKRTKKN